MAVNNLEFRHSSSDIEVYFNLSFEGAVAVMEKPNAATVNSLTPLKIAASPSDYAHFQQAQEFSRFERKMANSSSRIS